jgi:hypothetical protein
MLWKKTPKLHSVSEPLKLRSIEIVIIHDLRTFGKIMFDIGKVVLLQTNWNQVYVSLIIVIFQGLSRYKNETFSSEIVCVAT